MIFMRKLTLFCLLIFSYANLLAGAKNHREAWVGEWVELSCPAVDVPFNWEAAIMHSYYWSVSSSNEKKVTFSRNTTPTVGVTPKILYEDSVRITVKHYYYLSRVTGGKQDLKECSETHSFTLSCKKVNITLYPTEMTLQIGEAMGLQYILDNPSATPAPTISFESDNPSVASVDLYGNVYTHSEGEAKITASTNYFTSATCVVSVIPVEVVAITFPVPSLTMHPGQSVTLHPNVLPANATYKELTWASSNHNVVYVNDGILTALEPGFAEVKASASSGVFGTCYVTVTPINVSYIAIDRSQIELSVGDTCKLQPTIFPENSTYKTLTWESKDLRIASVDEYGVVTAESEGVTTISAIAHNGITGTCVISVKEKVGILDVSTSEQEYSIYSIEGILVDCKKIENLHQGVYIIKYTSGRTKIIMVR